MKLADATQILTEREKGTALFYAIERLGGELRLPLAELKRRADRPVKVWARLDRENGEIIFSVEGEGPKP